MSRPRGYIFIALICLFYWFLDSAWSFISFETNLKNMIFSEPGSYLDTFLLRVSPYQVVSRIMVIVLFLISGLLIVEFIIKGRKAEQKRKETHDSLMTVLNSIDATVCVVDMETHKILFMNQFMIDIFGGDYTGQLCHEAFRNRKEKCGHCTHGRLVDEQGQPSEVVVWESQNPVTKAWYMNHDRAIKWVDGRIVHLQVASDITRLKNLQAEQAHAELQLRQAQKMEAIGNLAGGIAHDFNNILATILGYTEIALDEIDKNHEAAAHMQEVLIAGNRAKDLVRQILTFARRSDGARKPLKVNNIAKEALAFLRSSIPSNIEIRSRLQSTSYVMANATEIHQVIMNLCTNATQAMGEEGGILRLDVRDIDIDTENEARALQQMQVSACCVEIKISDNGCGIPQEVIGSIFDPYFTTKGIGEGTGMGLAIVHGIVESYEGHIKVESSVGAGTVFTIWLPSAKNDAQPELYRQEMLPKGAERVLIVDDEASIAKMIEQSLKQLGYITTVRTSSMEALELFRARPNDFDIVVSDMTMPNMTGDVLAKEMRMIRAGIPFILCTGFSKYMDPDKARGLGIDAFLYKPIGKADLARSIRSLLGQPLEKGVPG